MAFDLVHRVLYEWDLKASEKLVMVVIAEHAQADHDWQAWPSIARLARVTGISEKHVRRTVQALEEKGCITIEKRKVGGAHVSNLYRAVPEWSPQASEDVHRGVATSVVRTPCQYPQDVSSTDTVSEGVRTPCPGGTDTMSGKTVIEPVKETVIPKPPPKMDEAQTIQGLWNEVAERHGLTKWVKVTKWHEKQAKDRVKEHGWDGIRKALSVIDSDPFYQTSEAKGWCDIRYFLRPGGRKEQPIVLLLEKADRPKGSFGDREDDAPLWKQVAEREKAAGGMR